MMRKIGKKILSLGDDRMPKKYLAYKNKKKGLKRILKVGDDVI